MSDPSMQVSLGRGLVLRNPVGLASGTAGYGFELAHLIDVHRAGALYTKGTTRSPRAGNAPPRVAETPGGMLNSIGLQNPGVDVVCEDYAPRFAAFDIPVIVNVAGADVDDYVHCVRRLDAAPNIAAIELNISCPNISGGQDFGRDAVAAAELMAAVRSATSGHVMVKLSPNVTDIGAVAAALEAAGADSLSAVNTYVGMKMDHATGRPVLAEGTGGMSGPAIHPLAVAAVRAVVDAVRIPVVGIGGIDSVAAALDFLDVGAVAVQVGTASFATPGAAIDIADGLRETHQRGRFVLRSVVEREAVRLLLVDDSGAVLLLHYRTADTGEDFWCTPGGALEAGESLEAAARRELFEETGQQLDGLGPLVHQREHLFRIGDGTTYRQQERYFIQRSARFEPDTSRAGAFERASIVGHHWWSAGELAATSAVLQPPRLAEILDRAATARSSPPVSGIIAGAREG